MGTEEAKSVSELEKKIFQIFSDFMMRITKFEELAIACSRLLVDFQQGLEFIRRPSIEKTSKLVEDIIKANETRRLLSYVEGGCVNALDSVRNLNNLVHTSQVELWNNLREAKCIVNELECLVEDVRVIIESTSESLPPPLLKDNVLELDLHKNEEIMMCHDDDVEKPEVTDYATSMAVVYSMVKQDYMMQERIVASLNLKSSSEEMDSYCLMLSLRPFISDEITSPSWKLIP